ncbi:hypothetical protein J2S05_003697 [Alkalicoccobacillus murimartini]|uniref:Uncharacterized protein n=1 Tax=Alkalicoccobacillus murimartini TaxID=171685 RepID=A0ABT9YMQ4_9BACI|nr:hypothetical protein [Alkalicoccobacillus murimartini]
MNNDLTFDAIQHASVLDDFKGKHLRIKALRINESGEPIDFFGHLIAKWTISSKELFIPLQTDNFISEYIEPLE